MEASYQKIIHQLKKSFRSRQLHTIQSNILYRMFEVSTEQLSDFVLFLESSRYKYIQSKSDSATLKSYTREAWLKRIEHEFQRQKADLLNQYIANPSDVQRRVIHARLTNQLAYSQKSQSAQKIIKDTQSFSHDLLPCLGALGFVSNMKKLYQSVSEQHQIYPRWYQHKLAATSQHFAQQLRESMHQSTTYAYEPGAIKMFVATFPLAMQTTVLTPDRFSGYVSSTEQFLAFLNTRKEKYQPYWHLPETSEFYTDKINKDSVIKTAHRILTAIALLHQCDFTHQGTLSWKDFRYSHQAHDVVYASFSHINTAPHNTEEQLINLHDLAKIIRQLSTISPHPLLTQISHNLESAPSYNQADLLQTSLAQLELFMKNQPIKAETQVRSITRRLAL